MYGSNIVTHIKLFWDPPKLDLKNFDWLITKNLIN